VKTTTTRETASGPLQTRAEPATADRLTVREFSVRAATLDVEARTVEAVIATEAPVRVYDWQREEMVEEVLLMAGVQLPDSRQVPLLDAHGRWSIDQQLGSTRDLRVEADRLIGVNTFARTDGGDAALALVRDGHLTDNSVGYRVSASMYIEPGDTAEVEGQSFTARQLPLRVSTRWTIHENSVCPIGADPNATNREAPPSRQPDNPRTTTQRRKDTQMDPFKKWLQARGLDYDTLDEAQRTALQADFDAEQARDQADPGDPPLTRADIAGVVNDTLDARATRAVETRRDEIRALAELTGVADEVRDEAIASDRSVADVRTSFTEILRGSRANVPGAPAVHVREGADESTREMIEAAILCRGNGLADAAIEQGRYTAETIERGRRTLRGITLLGLCAHALRLEGRAAPSNPDELIRAAVSTGSFANVTSNVAGVSAMVGAASVKQTWRSWCSIGDVSNFQANKLVRCDIGGNLATVGADGKLEHVNIDDTGESVTAATLGNILVLNRQVIRDDRIGILTKAPRDLGRAGIQSIAHTVYTLLLTGETATLDDGVAVFHATPGNLITQVLGPDGLEAAAAVLHKATTDTGLPRDLEPAVLLCAPENWGDAYSTVKTPNVVVVGVGSSAAVDRGIHAWGDGSIDPVSESRLSNATYTGYSATDWYLMASPAQADNVCVAFLDGQQNPTVRQVSPGAGILGVALEVFIDFGAAFADRAGMIKAAES